MNCFDKHCEWIGVKTKSKVKQLTNQPARNHCSREVVRFIYKVSATSDDSSRISPAHTSTQNIFDIPKSVTWLSSFPLSTLCFTMHIRVFAEQIVANKRRRYGWNGDWSLTNWISIYVRENVCMNVSKCMYVGIHCTVLVLWWMR